MKRKIDTKGFQIHEFDGKGNAVMRGWFLVTADFTCDCRCARF